MWTKAKKVGFRSVAAIGIVLALSGCSLLPKEEEALKPPLLKKVQENFELYEVKKGSITRKVNAVGTFVSSQTKNYYFTESGHRVQAVNVKLGDEIKPGDVIAELERDDLDTRIELQKINVEKAQIAMAQALKGDPNNEQEIQLKKLDVKAAQLQLDSLVGQLARTKLVATTSGVVTYVSDVKEGSIVDAFSTIATLSDPDKVQLVYETSDTSSLSGIQVGMEVNVKLNSSGKEVKGKVLQTPASAPQTDNKALAERNAKTIYVGLEPGTEGARIGNYGDMSITVEKRDDVLIIPKTGVRTYLGRDYVQVLDGEVRKEVDIEKGLTTATEVEVRVGLKEGQKVILNN